MEKAKNLITTHSNKIHYLMIIGATIGGINTICRPDFNFIIYLYMLYVWKFMEITKESQAIEKLSSFYILLFSLLIDIIWCLYWGGKWNSIENDPEKGSHILVLVLSWIGIIVKCFVLFMIGVLEWNGIKSSLPKNIQDKLNGPYTEYFDEI